MHRLRFALLQAVTAVIVVAAGRAAANNNTWTNAANNLTWDTTSANWTAPTIWNNANVDVAVFGSTGPITLASPIILRGMIFNVSSSGYDDRINGSGGNILTLTGGTTGSVQNGEIQVGGGAAITINATLAGTVGLTAAGPGTVVLTGTNTYTGGTTINTGAHLGIGLNGTSGNITGDVVDNGELGFVRSDATTFPGNISGGGDVFQSGNGTLTLTGTNSYTGFTQIHGGTLSLGSSGAIGTPFSGAILLDGGTLQFSANNTTDYSGQFNSGTTNYSIDTNGQSVTFASALTASAPLTKIGAGTLTLTNSGNTYSGGTTINGGTLRVANASGSATGTGPVTVSNGGTLAGGNGGGSVNPFADSTEGFISGAVTVQAGGIVAPGNNTAGLLTANGGFTFQSGSDLAVYLTTNNPRTGASPADVNTNSRLITPLDVLFGNSLTVVIDGGGQTYAVGNDYDFFIGRAGAAISLPASVTFVPTDFASPPSPGNFVLSQSAGDLILTFAPIPEPGTLALSSIAAIGWVTFWRRRWQRNVPSPTLSA